MSEMVERCIKAGIDTGLDFAQWVPDAQRELVEAIIKAMREPTMDMLHTAYALTPEDSECKCMNPGLYVEWKTMIDAAQK